MAASAAGSRAGIAGVMVHAVMALGMLMLVAAPMTTRSGVALLVASACLGASLVIAPAARARAWARDAIIDLWAMALLTLSMVAAHPSVVGSAGPATGGASVGHHIDGKGSDSLVDLATTPGLVVGAWVALRLVLLLKSRRRHTRRPSATPTLTPNPAHTPTLTPTHTLTLTPNPTHTHTPNPTLTLTPNPRHTPTPTLTPNSTLTLAANPTPTPTPSPAHTPTPTLTLNPTHTPTPTSNPTPTLTPNPTSTASHSRRPSAAIPTLTLAASPTSTTSPASCANPMPAASPALGVDATLSPTPRTGAALDLGPAPARGSHRHHSMIAFAASALQLLVMLAMH